MKEILSEKLSKIPIENLVYQPDIYLQRLNQIINNQEKYEKDLNSLSDFLLAKIELSTQIEAYMKHLSYSSKFACTILMNKINADLKKLLSHLEINKKSLSNLQINQNFDINFKEIINGKHKLAKYNQRYKDCSGGIKSKSFINKSF